jgi:hypothetical protein
MTKKQHYGVGHFRTCNFYNFYQTIATQQAPPVENTTTTSIASPQALQLQLRKRFSCNHKKSSVATNCKVHKHFGCNSAMLQLQSEKKALVATN